jgi:NodT family efflux transporter outer membrane factor (OMF) lipoprotein
MKKLTKLLISFAPIVLLLVLQGCASTGITTAAPKFRQAADLGLSEQASSMVQQRWWNDWLDPELQNLLEQAMLEHPSVALVQARVRRAQSYGDLANALSYVQSAASLETDRQRYSANGLFPPPIAGRVWGNNTVQLGASWNPDIWGSHAAALASALGQARAAEIEAAWSAQLLAVQIVRTEIALARLFEVGRANEQLWQVRQVQQALAKQRHEAGLDTRLEQVLSDAAVAEWRAQSSQIKEQIELMRHQLAALCGLAPEALAHHQPQLASMHLKPMPLQLGADLLGRRPEVVAARWRVEASLEDVKFAKTQFYPNVNIGLFAGYNSLTTEQLLNTGSRQFGVLPAVSLPLFDGGRLRSQLRGREAERDMAIAQYNQTLIDAVREAADAISSSQFIQVQIDEQVKVVASAQQAYQLALDRQQAGLSNQLPVLSAQANWIAQKKIASDLQARQLDQRVQLLRALGGDWISNKENNHD